MSLNVYDALETSFQAHNQNERIPKKVQILLLQWKKYMYHDHWQLILIYNVEIVGHLHYKTDTHSHAHLCTKHFEKHCDLTTLLEYIHKFYLHDCTLEICKCEGALAPPAQPSELPLVIIFFKFSL